MKSIKLAMDVLKKRPVVPLAALVVLQAAWPVVFHHPFPLTSEVLIHGVQMLIGYVAEAEHSYRIVTLSMALVYALSQHKKETPG